MAPKFLTFLSKKDWYLSPISAMRRCPQGKQKMEGAEGTKHFLSEMFSNPNVLGRLKGETCQP